MVPVAIVACVCAAAAGDGRVRKAVSWDRMNEHVRVYGPPRDDMSGAGWNAFPPKPDSPSWGYWCVDWLRSQVVRSLVLDLRLSRAGIRGIRIIDGMPRFAEERAQIDESIRTKWRYFKVLDSLATRFAGQHAKEPDSLLRLLILNHEFERNAELEDFRQRSGKRSQWGEPMPR